jgi:hypothetical protein
MDEMGTPSWRKLGGCFVFVLLDHYNLTKNSLYTLFGVVSPSTNIDSSSALDLTTPASMWQTPVVSGWYSYVLLINLTKLSFVILKILRIVLNFL